jgi:hypothetical protein
MSEEEGGGGGGEEEEEQEEPNLPMMLAGSFESSAFTELSTF